MNILIADDSLLSRSYIKKVLTMVGHVGGQIFEAENGRDALELLKIHYVQCLFLDLNMPVMTGVELLDAMIEQGLDKKTHVIVISSIATEVRMAELQSKGVKCFLRKPFTPEEFKTMMDTIKGALS